MGLVVNLPPQYGRSRIRRVIPNGEAYVGHFETVPDGANWQNGAANGIWTEDELDAVVISTEHQILLENIPDFLRDLVERIISQRNQVSLADLHDLEHIAHSVAVHIALND